MNLSKLLMSSSAIIMGLTGVLLIFLPNEIAGYIGINEEGVMILNILGSLYFGFSLANWTAKGSILGGIYGRALLFGNFGHFFTSCLYLIKLSIVETRLWIIVAAILYSIYAASFAYFLFFSAGIKSKDA